ncbi:hypothetical protein PBY51_004611 [Eleginops maclovinus]|uniref:Uncharacterized protein n=1 Tax=Eleginops maclovinus TaxID=56733 RepID=A0AAN7Y553_ELEMC|nr:hypothetical protein PBY51_004611 [Eleginops maclovinus]
MCSGSPPWRREEETKRGVFLTPLKSNSGFLLESISSAISCSAHGRLLVTPRLQEVMDGSDSFTAAARSAGTLRVTLLPHSSL